ncbi:MAG: GMP/IMP nucleotidase [Rhodocyclaceae bacterium]
MIDWSSVRSVFLDMDGTLLDLRYDNHFWLEHVPVRYAEVHGVDEAYARTQLHERYRRWAGTLQWYSVDFWSEELGLDIGRLKEEVDHLIAVRPHVPQFLDALRQSGRRITLVTNAHLKSLTLKMARTGLAPRFDAIVTAHDLGYPKEHESFWPALQVVERFDRGCTLLVDDSLAVLAAARAYGIAHLATIHRPDSGRPPQDIGAFAGVESFGDIMPMCPPGQG